MSGLSVSRLVNVTINLAPLAAARRGFGTLLIAGDLDVISGVERIRPYSGLEDIALDFGLSSPEYLAAASYFSQQPKPKIINIGRWLSTASRAQLNGGILTSAQKLISAWTSITDGGFKISVDGDSPQEVLTLNFSAAANLNAIAALIEAELTGITFTYDGSRFIAKSVSTGAEAALTFMVAPDTGIDISAQLKMTSATASPLVPGFDAESPVECMAILAAKSSGWYASMFAATTAIIDAEHIAVAGLIQGLAVSRIYGVTITSTQVLDSTVTNDLASRLRDLLYTRTIAQYSANSYAIASLFGRGLTVNFNANNSTITLMYKQEPGIAAEDLTEASAATLEAKRCNVFVKYDNNTAIIQNGVMSGPAFFDEIHGLDWFQNSVQNEVFNTLYQSPTKIPQTDAGSNQLVNAVSGVCEEAVNNGLAGAGRWNSDGFGQLKNGDYLKSGYYIYAQPMALQSQSEREQRKAPPIQVALKLAGAIHKADIIVNVNR